MALVIWRITDGKAGHDSQSVGLCHAIEKLKPCEYIDISADNFFSNCKNLLLRQFPLGKNRPDPALIIGAGHGCHLTMLTAKRARQGKTIVLMKPSLPLSFFDYCIVPKHDIPDDQKNVITTCGALNPVQFNENKTANTGLILLGGPSKHYAWNNDLILSQISQIVNENLETQWHIADSPRTPDITLKQISKLDKTNVEILPCSKTNSETIRELIFKTGNIWVSKDSVSMIYEALSSGAAVGLLEVQQKNKNRISESINQLINEKQLTSFEMWKNTNKIIPVPFKFNEADRCAALLLDRGMSN